jgi:hypothetical protein
MKLSLMILLGLQSFNHVNGFFIVFHANLSCHAAVAGAAGFAPLRCRWCRFGWYRRRLRTTMSQQFGVAHGIPPMGHVLIITRRCPWDQLWQHHDRARNMWAGTHVSVSVLGFNEAGELHMIIP